MNSNSDKDSIFSSENPREIPWFFVPVLLGIIALVVIFRWFD
ncbi:MAG: hypothetical protein ACE5GR_06870 [Nitrosopumilus sp.]